MGLLERLKQAEIERERNNRQNNIKLDTEYKFRLNDGKVHDFVPVQTYNNGKYIGVIADNEKFAIISKEKFEKLMEQNKALNKDIDKRPERNINIREEHDNTNNKQNRDNTTYSSVTIYDVSDDGDRYDSKSIPVVVDSNGNVYNRNGGKFYRSSEELKLDLENDTGKFYEDWMHANGMPITYEDKVADGIEPDVATESGDGQTVSSGLKAMREEVSKEEFKFTTKNYTDKEIEEAMEELDITTTDARWDA